MKFSVITPAYSYSEERASDLIRCINSVRYQTIEDRQYEHIVVDQTEKEGWKPDQYSRSLIKYFQQKHVERLYAIRKGFAESRGEWMCLLDSDDIYLPHYLETVSEMIDGNPKYKMFNFGNIYVSTDGKIRTRDSFKPAVKDRGHEMFGGGNIVNGTFVFHRSIWEKLGDFPTSTDRLWSPWDFSIAAQDEFPEIKPMFMVDHPDHPEGLAKELGNPWGQDYYLFYKYTRKYKSLPFDKHLLCVYAK